MVVFPTHNHPNRLKSNNKSCFVFIKRVQLTLQLDWDQANTLLLLCLSPSLMLPTYTEKQPNTTRSGTHSAESNSRKCWKSLTEVEKDESGSRPGSGSASDEPKAGATWRGIKHKLIPRGKTTDEQQTGYVRIWLHYNLCWSYALNFLLVLCLPLEGPN